MGYCAAFYVVGCFATVSFVSWHCVPVSHINLLGCMPFVQRVQKSEALRGKA